MDGRSTQQIDTIVIGAGQAGLSAGYHLAKRGLPFAILDADARIGDHWRERWDSLRLYSPARYDSLPGHALSRAGLPLADRPRDGRLPRGVRRAVRPARQERDARRSRRADRTAASSSRPASGASRQRQVIVATGAVQASPTSRISPIDLDPSIRPAALARIPQPGPARAGAVLVVGLSPLRRGHRVRGRQRGHRTILSGKSHGQLPDPGHRHEAGMLGWPVVEFMFETRPHDAHADGAADAPGGPQGRRPAPSDPQGGPGPRPASSATTRSRRRHATAADARRRHRARRCERHLVPPASARLPFDRGRRSSARMAGRSRSVASARRCRACTSLASRSSTGSRRCWLPVPAATPVTSSSRSPSGCTLATGASAAPAPAAR